MAQEPVSEGKAEHEKVKAKRRKTSALPWESAHGWRSVSVGDELLVSRSPSSTAAILENSCIARVCIKIARHLTLYVA